MKNLAVDIGTVSVEGVPADSRNGAAIGRSIERELGRQLRDFQGGPPHDLSSITIRDLRLPAHPTDAQIGEAVAAALQRALGRMT
ncbi:MAG: hypothetical protein QOH06_2175 [Acidobacteriota bacterium]|jgi:hypothetical protein|nr:hypothetical protein [Acidobacteriota bacterium]